MHPTLRQLKVFTVVARHLSYSRAAAELHLTQPAVSMQIKQLEAQVGLVLLEQVGKKSYLTEAGRTLVATCREVFGALERFEMAVAQQQGLQRGVLRLAAVSTAEYFLPRLLGPFCQRYPGVEVTLEITNRERLLTRLQDNLDDLYVFGRPPDSVAVEAFAFLPNPLIALAAQDDPLVQAQPLTLARFAQAPFLAREPGSGTRLAVERLFARHKLKLNIRMELGSSEAIKQAVAAGLGVSVVSQHTLLGGAQGLTLLQVEGFPVRRSWYLAYPKGKQVSVVSAEFLRYLNSEGKALAALAVRQAVPPA